MRNSAVLLLALLVPLCSASQTSPDILQQATAALRSGKHVVIEKPVSPTAAEVHDLAQLARKHNLKLSLFKNRPWDSHILTIRKLIHHGRLIPNKYSYSTVSYKNLTIPTTLT